MTTATVPSMYLSQADSSSRQGTVLTRSVLVNVTGSLANLAMQGTTAGIWKPIEGQQLKVFGLSADADAQLATNQLRTALIHEVKLLEHRSTFPVPMGATIECIPSHEKTDMGDGYAYTVLPHSVISAPQVLYECDVAAEDGQQWRKEFPKYTAANIDTEGTMDVNSNPFLFVHQDHPAIMVIRHNQGLIGCDIDKQKKIDGEWFKVTRQVFALCCNALRDKVLNRITSNDLNLFQVQLHRLNSQGWDDINDVSLPLQNFIPDPTWDAARVDTEKRAHVERFLSTPYTYMARLQIKYEIQSPS